MLMKITGLMVFHFACLTTFCVLFQQALVVASTNTSAVSILPNVTTSINKTLIVSISPALTVTATISASNSSNGTSISATSHYSSSANPTSTQATTQSSTAFPTGESRRFDGLSFFGGIILGAVICIVLFFALKFYRAKQRSYHSL